MASFEGEDDFEPYTADTFTVTEDTTFGEMALPDGTYAMIYEMRDAMNNYAYSEAAAFECKTVEDHHHCNHQYRRQYKGQNAAHHIRCRINDLT